MERKRTHKIISPDALRAYISTHPEATIREVAGFFGCNSVHLGQVIRKNKIDYRPKNSASLSKKELREYIQAHPESSQAQIAASFSCNPSVISRMIKKHKIEYHSKKFRKRGLKLPLKKIQKYIRAHPEATHAEIARAFKSNHDAIGKAIRDNKLQYKNKTGGVKPTLSQPKLEKYIQANPDATQTEIAMFFNCSTSCVSRALKKYNIMHKARKKSA